MVNNTTTFKEIMINTISENIDTLRNALRDRGMLNKCPKCGFEYLDGNCPECEKKLQAWRVSKIESLEDDLAKSVRWANTLNGQLEMSRARNDLIEIELNELKGQVNASAEMINEMRSLFPDVERFVSELNKKAGINE